MFVLTIYFFEFEDHEEDIGVRFATNPRSSFAFQLTIYLLYGFLVESGKH
jgi:hypothetical protein